MRGTLPLRPIEGVTALKRIMLVSALLIAIVAPSALAADPAPAG